MAEKKYFTAAVIGAIDIEIAYVAQYLIGREGWKRLSEKERQGAIMYATTQHDMIVMLYRKRLLEQIRVLVGNCIPNELVDETNVFKKS